MGGLPNSSGTAYAVTEAAIIGRINVQLPVISRSRTTAVSGERTIAVKQAAIATIAKAAGSDGTCLRPAFAAPNMFPSKAPKVSKGAKIPPGAPEPYDAI